MNPDHQHEYTKRELELLLSQSKFKQFDIIPIGFIRISTLEITYIPSRLSNYSDQIMIVARKQSTEL